MSVLPLAMATLIARFMGPTWGSSETDRAQVGPMLAPWTLLSGERFDLYKLPKIIAVWPYILTRQYTICTFFISQGAYSFLALFTNCFFARNSNSMEISPGCNSGTGNRIATSLCICHDSAVIVPCTTLCSDHLIKIEVRVKSNLHRIWIAMENR